MSNRTKIEEVELDLISGGNIDTFTEYNAIKNTSSGKWYNITLPEGMSYQDLSDWVTNNRTSLGGDDGTIDEMIKLGYIDATPLN